MLDELHTYRGRQGADVAMLVRRVRDACEAPDVQVVGTSATMASGGTAAERRQAVAAVASRLFGTEVGPDRVIGGTLLRATALAPSDGDSPGGRVQSVAEGVDMAEGYETLAADPLAGWVEETFGLAREPGTGAFRLHQFVSKGDNDG